MFFWNKICVIAPFFVISFYAADAQKIPGLHDGKISLYNYTVKASDPLVFSQKNVVAKNVMIAQQEILRSPISSDLYASRMGFFCKQELKIQKATGIPLFLRLGSLRQCNYLEGKN